MKTILIHIYSFLFQIQICLLLSHIKNIVILYLPNNSLSRFDAFIENTHIKNVMVLSLEYNKLNNLFHKVTIKQRQYILIDFNISYNFISVVDNFAFEIFNNLLSIDLTSNKITTLRAHSFNGLCCLSVLKLLNNFILTISTKTI